jgi:hypothetical protein
VRRIGKLAEFLAETKEITGEIAVKCAEKLFALSMTLSQASATKDSLRSSPPQPKVSTLKEAIITRLMNDQGWRLISCFPTANGTNCLTFSSTSSAFRSEVSERIPNGALPKVCQQSEDSTSTLAQLERKLCGSKDETASTLPQGWRRS